MASALAVALVVGVAVLLAWDRRPYVVVVLASATLVFSALLLLPSDLLRRTLGREAMRSLDWVAQQVPLSLGDLGHVAGFALLTVLLWWLRPGLRGWALVVLLLGLAFAAEAMQLLTPHRAARIDDVWSNLAGVGLGLLVVVVGWVVGRCWVAEVRR